MDKRTGEKSKRCKLISTPANQESRGRLIVKLHEITLVLHLVPLECSASSVCQEYSYKDVRRWTVKAKIDIFELDYVIFPMNIGETHWAMGAIDLKDKGFRYFDSMFSTSAKTTQLWAQHHGRYGS